jgi:hypothetical protein
MLARVEETLTVFRAPVAYLEGGMLERLWIGRELRGKRNCKAWKLGRTRSARR